ncbi:MAG: hypothetical protein NTZ59_06695, partial [Bacteroidetes bacterium]|nr:hypothetical protein [Bacteroidota bacterium]
MQIIELVKFLGSSAIIMSGVIFIAKKIIDKSLDGAVEKYKASLQKEADLYKHNLNKETEILKFDLNKISLEYQSKYNTLHKERLDIIKDIYGEIINLDYELIKLTSVFQGPEWKKTEHNFEIRDLIIRFEKDFEIKRLYFAKNTCENVEKVIERMKTINHNMYKAKLQEETNQELEKYNNTVTTEERLQPKKTWRELEI